jgi:prepilin signal peptidase PulO-like enzyme (type II secretory pathway)
MSESKIVNTLDVFSNSFLIILLIYVLFSSMVYWSAHYPFGTHIYDQMFYIAVLIAILTVLGQWIERRFLKIIKIWEGRRHGRRKERRKTKAVCETC